MVLLGVEFDFATQPCMFDASELRGCLWKGLNVNLAESSPRLRICAANTCPQSCECEALHINLHPSASIPRIARHFAGENVKMLVSSRFSVRTASWFEHT